LGNSTKGDLLPFLSGHFDTTSGSKVETASYKTIHKALCESKGDLDISSVLFVTDNIKESIASKAAEMHTGKQLFVCHKSVSSQITLQFSLFEKVMLPCQRSMNSKR